VSSGDGGFFGRSVIALFVGEHDAPDVRGGLAPVSWTPDSEPLSRFALTSLEVV
jgi:hypothetical protein